MNKIIDAVIERTYGHAWWFDEPVTDFKCEEFFCCRYNQECNKCDESSFVKIKMNLYGKKAESKIYFTPELKKHPDFMVKLFSDSIISGTKRLLREGIRE